MTYVRRAVAKSVLQKSAHVGVPLEQNELDTRLSSILVEIEQEIVPDRLLKLAIDLQSALTARRQQRSPN